MKSKIFPTLLISFSLCALHVAAAPETNHLIVHEWGTFTSFQGADGVLAPWKPLETSRLPQFVYDLKKPGLNRVSSSMYGPIGKVAMSAMQRLETPVVYFYSDREQNVDLEVNFPSGTITEWFPQAHQVGPTMPSTNALEMPTSSPYFTSNSLIHWTGLQVLPAREHPDTYRLFPGDTSGSHYFTARETDADFVRVHEISKTNPQPEYEKFLFYRGVGNFTTPLRVTMSSEQSLTMANTGTESLPALFVLVVKNQMGTIIPVAQLAPGIAQTVDLSPKSKPAAAGYRGQIATALTRALVDAGLYQREAEAMVKTWDDSWFTEEGVRVLYLLPRSWTDATLPMALTPKPDTIARVMVGRAEVLTPELEQVLVKQFDKAAQGDAEASGQMRQIFQRLGRFAEPALLHALNAVKVKPEDQAKLYALLAPAPKGN